MTAARLSGGTNPTHLVSAFALSLAMGCAAPASARAQVSLEPPYELVINGVVDSALDDLRTQMRRLPAFAVSLTTRPQDAGSAPDEKDAPVRERVVIVVDPS